MYVQVQVQVEGGSLLKKPSPISPIGVAISCTILCTALVII